MHRFFVITMVLSVFHWSHCTGMQKPVGKKAKRRNSVRFKKRFCKAYTNCGFQKSEAKECLKNLKNAWQEYVGQPLVLEKSWGVFV